MRCIASHLVAAMLLAGGVVVNTALAASPVRIAVFPFELMDFSAAAPLVPPDDIDREQLRLSTEEARRLIAESGRYQLVDVGPVHEQIAKAGPLRDCEGCEAGIAAGLAADQSMIGIVTRITRMEYAVTYKIRDIRGSPPMEKMKLPSAALALVTVAILCAAPVRQARAQGATPVVAVAEINYVDTSGEVIDQSADHRRRLREFEAALRSDLAASGKMASAALECPPNACSVGDIGDRQLLEKAEQAGATHLLIGRFHKMSTLVQQAKFDIIDVKARKMVFDRYITFRGDNDAAWRHAESFVARQILNQEW